MTNNKRGGSSGAAATISRTQSLRRSQQKWHNKKTTMTTRRDNTLTKESLKESIRTRCRKCSLGPLSRSSQRLSNGDSQKQNAAIVRWRLVVSRFGQHSIRFACRRTTSQRSTVEIVHVSYGCRAISSRRLTMIQRIFQDRPWRICIKRWPITSPPNCAPDNQKPMHLF